MKYSDVARELEAGNKVEFKPTGNSMTPIIKSRQRVVVEPLTTKPIKGDVVLAKVKGRYFLHKITAIKGDQYQISNNHGHVNGWSSKIYGKVTKVGDE